MSTLTPPRRSRRFHRKPNPPGCVLNARKIRLLRALARDRFLTSHQLTTLDGGSKQKVLRILRALFDHELVRRKRQLLHIVNEDAEDENLPLVYSLTHAGAKILADADQTPMRDYNWTTKTKRRKAEHIKHTVDIAHVMHAFAKSSRERGWDLRDHRELVPDFPQATHLTAKGASPFSLRVEIQQQDRHKTRMIGVIPDRLFSPRHGRTRFNFALELDEGTMPIFRWKSKSEQLIDFDDTSIVRKVVVYHRAWQQDLHVTRWGFQQFRVLFVTPIRERISEMLEAVKFETGGKGAGLFVFTDFGTLLANDPFGPIWIDGYGEVTPLIPELQNAPLDHLIEPPR